MFRFRPLRRLESIAVLAAGIAIASAWGTEAGAQTGVWRQIPLPGSGISALAAGDSGTVLVASSAGAFQLDGLRARRIPVFAATGDSLEIEALLRTSTGDIWIGTTNQGLFRLRPDGTVDRHTVQSGVGNSTNDEILSLAQTADGAIWAGTNAGGLSRFDGSTWTTLTTDQGLPAMSVSALAADPRDGSLWAGTRGPQAGLAHVVHGTVVSVHDQFPSAPTENVHAVLVGREGDVWIGHDGGLARLDGPGVVDFPAAAAVVALAEGSHGDLWLGTGNRGIGRWDLGSVRILPSGPPSSTIRSVHVDAAGVLWTGTTSALARFEGAGWLSHARTEGLPAQAQVFTALRDMRAETRADSIDSRGVTWFGTSGTFVDATQTWKLSRRANGRMLHFGTAEGLPPGNLVSLALAESGAIWCGLNGAIARVRADGTVSRVVGAAEGWPAGYVLDLEAADDGNAWAATVNGAVYVDPGGIRVLPVGEGAVPDAPLTGVARDDHGRVWFSSGENPFGTDPRPLRGAVRFDPADSSVLAVTTAEGLPTNDLNGVTVAPGGDVWFASDFGAIRYRDGAVRPFGVPDGLPSNVVHRIDVAPDGTVWAATGEGLALFDGTAWASYNVGDGLVGTRVLDVFADSLGVLASCRLEGVSLFHPDRTPPRVEVVSGPPPATGASLVQFVVRGGDLDSDESRIRISHELVGLGPPTPFLEDVDAVALDLLDGEYLFRVRAKDRALNETAEPFEWRFTVDATPPRPVVTQPAFNAVVTDTVEVLGRVDDPRFAHYLVELRREGAIAWDTLLVSPTPPPVGAPLFAWPSRSVDDGVWELRVGAEDSLGLIGYVQVSVIVDNSEPRANVTSPATIDHVTGGRVFSTGGEVELYVPPNAFAADRIVRIDPLPLSFPIDRGPAVRLLTGWNVRASGEEPLAKPVTLTIALPSTEPEKARGSLASSLIVPISIARLAVTGTDTTLVPVGGALSADGSRITASVNALGPFVIAHGLAATTGASGVSALDCQPRVISPRGGGFDTRTAISFELGQPGSGAIKVYDRAGRLVKELSENGQFLPGSNVVYWDGTDGDGEVVPSGLYTVAVRFDGKTSVRTVAVANR